MNNELSWDGSWLPDECKILTEYSYEHRKFCYLEISSNKKIIGCEISKLDDSLTVIIDEISPLFKIKKRGSHRIIIDKIKYVIFHVDVIDDNLICDVKLSRIENNDPIRKEIMNDIRKLIIFQDLISIDRIGESHIIIKNKTDTLYALGFYTDKNDLNYKASYNFSNISKTLYNKYFNEKISINDVRKEMIDKNYINDLRIDIEFVIKRINKDYMWYGNFLINRINNYF